MGSAIYPDHGWGGNQGHITDRLFREKYEYARDRGKEIVQGATTAIAKKINFNTKHPYAITVFNALSWERTDPVTFTLDVEGREHTRFCLVDEKGNEIDYQLASNHSYAGNHDEVITITFVAGNVPALGYKTYYLVEGTPRKTFAMPSWLPVYENSYYRMELGDGGIRSLYGKQLKKEVFQTGKYSAAELFTMHSEGNGAGEFTDIQQPDMRGFDKLSHYRQYWQCVETGLVRDVFQTIQPLKETTGVLRIIAYKTVK
ncbi:MAG: hypothetical protein LIO97_12285 [Tannerellaceae bacterium]|nr:hypothetical protein [Tannerellaceae bacterium]